MAYTSRKRRERMAARDSAPVEPVAEEVETMDEGMPVAESETPADEKIAAFVPMTFFGGKTVKVGDRETVVVKAIDPETGEVQVECEYSGGEGKSMGEAFDEAMPA